MNICYGTTAWALFFTFCEVSVLFIIGFYYTRSILNTIKEGDQSRFEFLDWILIYLSTIQIYLSFFGILLGSYFGFVVLLEVMKFSQNFLIGGILLYQILIWHKYAITYDIVKYFIFALVLIDIASIISSLGFEGDFFEYKKCKSETLNLLIIIGFVFNLIIIIYAVYKNFEEKGDQKSLNLLAEDQHNLNDLIQRFASDIKKMKKYYLIIIICFTFSFFVDIFYHFFMTNFGAQDIEVGTEAGNNTYYPDMNTIVNNTLFDNETSINSTIYPSNTLTGPVCSLYSDLKDAFNFKEYLICFLSFFFRDLGPHIYIYLAIFIYKPHINSRSNSFIELI